MDDLKLRYRCSNCKNLESHDATTKKKRKCEKCGTNLTEITEKDYQHYKSKKEKKEEKEDKKEGKKKDKKDKKKKKSEKDDDSSDTEDKKSKHKLKRSNSTKNIDDKNYKLKKQDNEEDNLSQSIIKDKKKENREKKNRRRSLEKLGPVLSKVVNNIFKGGKHLEKGLKKLQKIDFEKYTGTDNANIKVNHYNDRPTEVFVNGEKIKLKHDTFDGIFKHFNDFFSGNFQNNYAQNFMSSNQSYFGESPNIRYNNNTTTNIINNGDDDSENEEDSEQIKEDKLAKLRKFKLTEKYCKKGKNDKLELPSCCICLSEIKLGKHSILLPCAHLFHYKCGANWLKDNSTCPMCRQEI